MRKFQIYILVAAVACLASCKEKEETPKVIYDSKPEKVVTKPDSSQIKIADLPIHMEGTKYLIHAIGDVRVYDGKLKDVWFKQDQFSELCHFQLQ
jgi:hypothetical protein